MLGRISSTTQKFLVRFPYNPTHNYVCMRCCLALSYIVLAFVSVLRTECITNVWGYTEIFPLIDWAWSCQWLLCTDQFETSTSVPCTPSLPPPPPSSWSGSQDQVVVVPGSVENRKSNTFVIIEGLRA